MKGNPIHRRAMHSLCGIRTAWQRERSFRTQVLLSLVSLVALVGLRPDAAHWMAVVTVLAAAVALELMNSAFEALTDQVHPGRHPQIKAAKDIASAAAFVLNCAAALVVSGTIVESMG